MRPALGTGALGVMLLLVAAVFDAEQLYVPGVAFAVLAAAAAAWIAAAARGLRVERTLAARRVVEEEPLDVELRLRGGRVPLPTGVLADPLLPGGVALRAGSRSQRIRIRASFGRRGRRRFEAPAAVLRDPLGLATRTVTGAGGEGEVLVLPRVEPVRAADAGSGERGGRRRPAAVAAEVEVDGVREHRPGTPASRIYWPALARGAGLMERRLRADSDATPLVLLDTRLGAGGGDEDADAAVRACASLVLALARAGAVAALLPGDRRPVALDASLGGWAHLHARLALVAANARPSLTGVRSRQGAVVYVAARVPSRPLAVLEHAPAAGRVLVVPGTLAGRRPAFTVAGCHGYELEARARGGARSAAVAALAGARA